METAYKMERSISANKYKTGRGVLNRASPTGELWGMGHDKFDTICEQNINYFTSGSSCLSVLYAIPHEGTEGHEYALWMATRDWLNSICCIYFRYRSAKGG